MRKSQEVLGATVIHQETNKVLGVVTDLLFNSEQVLAGLLLERGGWLRFRRYIPIECIVELGFETIRVHCEEKFSKQAPILGWTGVVTGVNPLRGRPIETANGLQLGEVMNVYFLENLGTIVGYELSDGWWNDLLHGRKKVIPDQPYIWKQMTVLATCADST
ncbi:uncharacterized protein YrrD [Croceifilum oryzae]|uniref:Uncharacterized protein YrrD n=1 Tax=Croceifilum oryzae TaxID=1553429 RepID=A0AAJ1TFW9_9BACL|nr:PRC-barrel domain-containing protein [Croceifilum oryzae]MDQ0417779.1 uncharacterized protein YrrD [Croceifilum oryzae]